MVEWLLTTAVQLPASLNDDFRTGLDPVLHDVSALLRASGDDLSAAAPAIAKTVVEWLNL